MNDIMSRFLVVMDTEAEAYWMFVNYMEVFKNDFMEEGMLRKICEDYWFFYGDYTKICIAIQLKGFKWLNL